MTAIPERPPGRSLIILVILLGVASACRRGVIAELKELQGQVDGEKKGAWSRAPLGTTFVAGDAVRTGPRGGAGLGFAGGRVLRMGENAVVRFLPGGKPAKPAVNIEMGSADIEGDGELTLATSIGMAELEPGTKMRVVGTPDGTRYEVLVGRANFENGKAGSLTAGDGLIVAVGGTIMERYKVRVGSAQVEPLVRKPAAPIEPPPVAAAPTEPDPPPEHSAKKGVAEESPDEPAGPLRPADVLVQAGETATVHDPRPPAMVRLTAKGPCPAGVLEMSSGTRKTRRKLSAEGIVVLAMSGGSHRYRIVCADGFEAGDGSISIRRDPGTSPVPKTAPVNLIDADGRKYTVLYQNRLPALTFVWPRPPAGTAFKLLINTGEKSRELATKGARHVLPPGTLGEGEHRFWFSDGKVESARTTLAVVFDNAAATAQLKSPRDSSQWAGSAIEIAGVAMEGSTVSVAGIPLSIDRHGRFTGEVPRPSDSQGLRALAIRLAHPRSGVHYYIRRSANAPR